MNGGLAGLCQVQTTEPSYKRHGLILANGIIDMPAWTPPLVVVANYRHEAVTLPKGAHLGTAKPFEGDMLTPSEEDPVAPLGVLSVTGTLPREPPTSEHSEPQSSMTDMPTEDQEALMVMAEADLDHLNPAMAEEVRRMLRKNEVMWTGGALGTIGATQHRFDLVPGARPVRSQPHRAGPLQRDFADWEVKRMRDAEVIRPSI